MGLLAPAQSEARNGRSNAEVHHDRHSHHGHDEVGQGIQDTAKHGRTVSEG